MSILPHAWEGMGGERPPLRLHDVEHVLEAPDHDDGQTAWKRLGRRTVIVRYTQEEDRLLVRSVSCTRRRFPPHLP